MKTLIRLFALVATFTFLAATASNAQSAIENKTTCEFTVLVEYGDANNCTVAGRIQVSAQPEATVILPIPAGSDIITAKGAYATSSFVNCPFLVGACAPNPQTDNVNCNIECGSYTVILSSNNVAIF